MAAQSSTIQIIFEGAVSGLQSAAGIVENTIGRVGRSADTSQPKVSRLAQAISILGRGFTVAGAGAASIQAVVGTVAALSNGIAVLAPAALALPGIFLGIGAAVGTLKLGLMGIVDSFKDTKAGVKAFQSLSAEGKNFVTTIKSMGPAAKELKDAVQTALLTGLAPQIKATGVELIALGKQHLPLIARGFNAMGISALEATRTPVFTGQLGTIFADTTRSVGYMRDTVANLLTGIVGLGSVGSRYLGVLAGAIDDAAARFADWVQNGINDGSIDAALERAEQGFRDLRDIVANVAAGARAMATAFTEGLAGPGGAAASALELSEAFRSMAISPEVQNTLRAIGETVRVVGDSFRTVLLTAIRELGPVIVAVAPFVQALAVAIKDGLVFALELIGPIALRVAEFLGRNKDVIVFLTPIVVALYGALKILRIVMLAVLVFRVVAFFTSTATAIGLMTTAARFAFLAIRVLFAPLLAIAGIVGLALVADQLNEINIAAAGGDPANLTGFAESLNDLVGAGRQLLSGDFSGILTDIKGEWQQVVDSFSAGTSPAGAAFQKISTSFQNDLVTPVSTAGQKIGTSFQTDFVDFFAGLPATISSGAQPVLDFFTNLPTTISTAAGDLGSGFTTKAQEIWTAFLSGLTSFFGPVLAFFTSLPATIATGIGDLGSFFTTKAQEIWTAFLGGLTSFFAPVLAFFSQTPYQMGFAIGAAIGEFITVAINLWNAFLTGCQQGIAAVIAFCAALPGQIIAAISSFVALVVTWAVTAWNAALAATITAANAIIGWATALPGQIIAAVTSFVAMIVAWATNAWNSALNTSITLANAIVGYAAALPGRIIAAVTGFIAMIVNWARNAWTGAQTTTTSVVTAIFSYVQQIPGKIIGFLASLGGQLRSNATTSWEAFRGGVIAKANEAVTFVQSLPGRIVSALGNLGSLLVGAGRSIIDGLLAGIRAGVQAMFDFVSGIAAGIAARKGPLSYDRVLLVPAGLAIMQGLQAGLETGNKAVQRYVGTIADDLAGSLAAGASLAPVMASVASLGSLNPGLGPAAALPLSGDQMSAALRATPAPVTYVTVKIGETELRGIVDQQVETTNREVARVVGAGTGRG